MQAVTYLQETGGDGGHENILYMQRTVLFGRISPRTEKQICIKMTFWSMTNMNDDEAEQKVMKAM